MVYKAVNPPKEIEGCGKYRRKLSTARKMHTKYRQDKGEITSTKYVIFSCTLYESLGLFYVP